MLKALVLTAALLATVACQQQQATPAADAQNGNLAVEATNTTPPAAPPPPPSAPAIPASPVSPTPAAVPPTPESGTSVAAAKTVIDAYFAALATGHYEQAYRMWGGNGEASGMSLAQFTASFTKYKIYDGTAYRPGEIEGAAGSAYIEFPVTVTGLLAKGGGFHLSGPMTLRRVNDVDGSTPEQRHWHIASSGLKPRP